MSLKDFQILTKILKSNHMVKYEYDNKGQEFFSENQDAYKINVLSKNDYCISKQVMRTNEACSQNNL
jgi:hypothetical protein